MDSLLENSLSDRLSKRDRERKNIIEKRKEEHQSLTVECEQTSFFKESFYSVCKSIQDSLDSASTSAVSNLPNIFDKINKDIHALKNYLSQSKMFLKVYDIRRAQETLQLLENNASELEIKLLPKKKFGFRNKKSVKKTCEKSLDVTDSFKDMNITEAIVNRSSKSNNKLLNMYSDTACMILGKVDEQLVLDAENVNKNDILLSDLVRCTVKIYGTPSTLHMINLKECTILVGPVTSSVFVHECINCVFAFACQQLRLHSSINCIIYMHVTSRAIIEDCSKIRVAPYNWSYKDQASHFNLAGLDPNVNNWESIDDFNWLSTEKHSPNWSVLEPELRIKKWE